MNAFSHLNRCIEIRRGDIVAAASCRKLCKDFLDRVAEISRPHDGGPLILLLFSRIATLACEWLDGDLRIELTNRGAETQIDVQVSLGVGASERVFPRHVVKASLSEFEGAIARVPQMIWPLSLQKTHGSLRLAASRAVRSSTVPPAIEIDPRSQSLPRLSAVPSAVARRTLPYATGRVLR